MTWVQADMNVFAFAENNGFRPSNAIPAGMAR